MFINKKRKAFTLQETLIVMVLMGFLVVLTVASTINSSNIKEKKIAVASKNFYSNITNSYNYILSSAGSSYSIENLKNATGDEKKDNKLLMSFFNENLNGDFTNEDATCEKLSIRGDYMQKYKVATLACSEFPGGIIAGLSYNHSCISKSDKDDELTLSVLEVLEYFDGKNAIPRRISNTCGYIIYGFKDGMGIFGQDLFLIALGKHSIK